ncbi:MAG: adenosylhomocysteinase [Negativicutes bacterium]|jgi:adenosylhomocysteinase
MNSIIKDINLAAAGNYKIDWVSEHMPVLNALGEEMAREQTFAGKKIVATIHLEAKTAYLALILKRAGAEMIVTGSNPLSTQDDVCAALVQRGVQVFATHGCTAEEYDHYLLCALDTKPDILIDDGGDLVNLLHSERRQLLPNVIGVTEETTTGVHRHRALERAGQLCVPIVAVNDSYCKYLFDNRYGTGQSTWDGIMRTTNLTIAGKNVVVAGYGWCGKGVAMRAKGLGANVTVTEVDPIKAIEAVFDGFRVMTMLDAARIGDIFVTVTGNIDVIRAEHFAVMKNGAILSNAGHFDVEISKPDLVAITKEKTMARNNIEQYKLNDDRKIYLLAEGRLVNLAAGDGHPAEIMDLSFAMQCVAVRYLLQNQGKLENKVHVLPPELDMMVARLKLETAGVGIDSLTAKQDEYMQRG